MILVTQVVGEEGSLSCAGVLKSARAHLDQLWGWGFCFGLAKFGKRISLKD